MKDLIFYFVNGKDNMILKEVIIQSQKTSEIVVKKNIFTYVFKYENNGWYMYINNKKQSLEPVGSFYKII